MSNAVHISINDIPIDYIGAASLRVSRGAEPSMLTLLVRDEDGGGTRFDELVNPVVISITTPDAYGESVTLKLENWHISEVIPNAPGVYALVLEDCRKLAVDKGAALTVDYNVYVAGYGTTEVARLTSLKDSRDWTCYEAAQDIIERFGLVFEPETDFPAELEIPALPRNLGNSIGGGFVGATWIASVQLALEPIHCDVIVLPNGNVSITDRKTEHATELDKYSAVAGIVAERDRHWQKPQFIDVLFQNRIERWLYADEVATAANWADLDMENVVPRSQVTSVQPGHEHIEDALQRVTGAGVAAIRRFYMCPIMIDRAGPTYTATERAERAELEGYVRACLRTRFRVKTDLGRATLMDVRLGHIGTDGKTKSEDSVYMAHERVIDFVDVGEVRDMAQLAESATSTAVPFDITKPAPWVARFGYDDAGELILELVSEHRQRHGLRRYIADIPGLLNARLAATSLLNQIDPTFDLNEASTERRLVAGWFVYVFYHGLQVAPRPEIGLPERVTTVQRPLFDDGPLDTVSLLVSDMTANYATVRTSGANPGRLPNGLPLQCINATQIEERADYIRDQARKYFEDGRAGIVTTAGVEAITAGKLWVRGNVQSMTIEIGAKAPFTVECKWVVLPEISLIRTDDQRKALQGVPPRMLA